MVIGHVTVHWNVWALMSCAWHIACVWLACLDHSVDLSVLCKVFSHTMSSLILTDALPNQDGIQPSLFLNATHYLIEDTVKPSCLSEKEKLILKHTHSLITCCKLSTRLEIWTRVHVGRCYGMLEVGKLSRVWYLFEGCLAKKSRFSSS